MPCSNSSHILPSSSKMLLKGIFCFLITKPAYSSYWLIHRAQPSLSFQLLPGNLLGYTECYLLWVTMLAVKNVPANAGDVRGSGWIPGAGRSPWVGNSNLLYSCWRTAWTELHSVGSQSRTQLKRLSTQAWWLLLWAIIILRWHVLLLKSRP